MAEVCPYCGEDCDREMGGWKAMCGCLRTQLAQARAQLAAAGSVVEEADRMRCYLNAIASLGTRLDDMKQDYDAARAAYEKAKGNTEQPVTTTPSQPPGPGRR